MTCILSYSVRLRQQRNIDLHEHITCTTLVVSSDVRYLEGRFFHGVFSLFPALFDISRRYHEWVDYSLTTMYGTDPIPARDEHGTCTV